MVDDDGAGLCQDFLSGLLVGPLASYFFTKLSTKEETLGAVVLSVTDDNSSSLLVVEEFTSELSSTLSLRTKEDRFVV